MCIALHLSRSYILASRCASTFHESQISAGLMSASTQCPAGSLKYRPGGALFGTSLFSSLPSYSLLQCNLVTCSTGRASMAVLMLQPASLHNRRRPASVDHSPHILDWPPRAPTAGLMLNFTSACFCSRSSSTGPIADAGVRMPPFARPAFSQSSSCSAATNDCHNWFKQRSAQGRTAPTTHQQHRAKPPI